MTRYVIRLAGLRGRITEGNPDQAVGAFEYLAEYDPDRFEGRGFARWTTERDKALTFGSATEAAMFYMTVPASLPKRPDGLPNRPLMAFNVLIEPLDEVAP